MRAFLQYCFLTFPQIMILQCPSAFHELFLHAKGESLCVLEYLKRQSLYNVWVMKETWTKLYSISLPCTPLSNSFAISEHGDKAFVVENFVEVAVLNMEDVSLWRVLSPCLNL